MKKRILSLVTMISIFIGILPNKIFATDFSWGGTGTLNNPYRIYSIDDLNQLSISVNSGNDFNGIYFELQCDIDSNSSNFTPIGNFNVFFNGIFNGNGHKITNIKISSSKRGIGLFGGVGENGSITNLGVENATITSTTGYSTMGAVVGYNLGIVDSCYNENSTVSGGSFEGGGVVGTNASSAIVSNCYNSGTVTGGTSGWGGVVGYNINSAKVYNCYNVGKVSAHHNVGGVVGDNYGDDIDRLFNCYSLKNMTSGGNNNYTGVRLKTENELKSISTYEYWNFSTIWQISDGDYPKLQFGNDISYLKLSVHKTDNNNIANNIEYSLDSLLSSVTLCDTIIKGPTFDVAGHNICPLEFGAKAILDFSGLSKNITIDKDNKKVHVILGKLNKDGSASVVQTTDMCDASWSKQYNEIKDLYKSMTGFNANGSDRNGISNWNKFEKMKAELNHMNCDMFINASMDCLAYLDFDYQTGYLQLSEGGFIESASLGANFKYPLIGNCLYATLGLKGSETGTIKATVTSTGSLSPYMSIKPSITAKAAITGEIPFLCKAEGGIDATLAVLLQTFSPNLTVTMNGNIFFNASALNKTFVDWNKPYLNVELYPEFKTLSLMSLDDTYRNIYDNAESMPRDYLNSISLFSLENENTIYQLDSVYPQNEAQLVQLPGNAMMLVWTGDDGTKSDINRTSIFYSIYKDGVWSEAQKIAEDGTATGYFKAVSDGEKAYIVYQKLSQVLSDDTSVENMLAVTDLYMIEYENGIFGEPVCLTNYDNMAYEFISDVNLNSDKLTIAWIENSENDVFLSAGTTAIKTCNIENGSMSDISTISTISASENQYPGDVHIYDDKIYYSVYDSSGEETTSDLYTYSNAASEKMLDADGIYNIKNIGDTLYYIKNSSVYKYENGTETALGFDNITSFEIISNGDYCSMLMADCNGARNEIYISSLINGEWSQAERFTDLGKYVRSYSPFMYSDGTINLAVSVADVKDDISAGESVYGNTSIMVLNQCDYCDISTSYVYYEEDEIKPDSDMNLYFDVNNDCADSLNSFKVKLTDEIGNQLDEQTVSCSIKPFSTETFSIKYHLPQNMSKTQLNLAVSIDREEKDYSNNTMTTEFGYANLSVMPIECTVNKNNTADIKSTISNIGFEDAENVVARVYNGSINGEVLEEINIGSMQVGETYDVTYTFPKELMVSPDEDVMNAVYIQAETSSKEALYSDNDQKVAFDSYVNLNPSIISSPTENTLTYTGTAQELVTAGTAEGGTIQYSLNGENYSVDIPTAINAGEYTVYYKVVGDEGYNDIEPQSILVTIAPKTAELTIPALSNVTYGVKLSEIELPENWSWSDADVIPAVGNSGYEAVYTVTDYSNYDWNDIEGYDTDTHTVTRTIPLTANKANSEVSAANMEITYGEQLTLMADVSKIPTAQNMSLLSTAEDKVEFFAGETLLGTADVTYTDSSKTSGTAEITVDTNTRQLKIGNNTITAVYGGSVNLNGSENNNIIVNLNKKEEDVPELTIDFENETLIGLADNAKYIIDNVEADAQDGKIALSNSQLGTTLSIVRKARDEYYSDSAAQTLKIPARPDKPTTVEAVQPDVIGGTGTIKGITEAMEYSTDNGATWTDGNGSDITNIVGSTTYLVRYKATNNKFKSDNYSITIDIFGAEKEPTPSIDINYADETLTGFESGTYAINGTIVTVENGVLNIDESYYGKPVSIVKKGNGTTTNDSDVQEFTIPARPSTPNVVASAVTAVNKNNGKITGTTSDMEYRISGGKWTNCTGSEITELAAGTYEVRVKGTDRNFSGSMTQVIIDTECVKITAIYTSDGVLENIKVETVNISEITPPQNTATNKTFYWESLESMKPVKLN